MSTRDEETREINTTTQIVSENDNGREDTVPVDLTPLAKQMRNAEKQGKGAYLLFLDGMDMGRVVVLDDRPIIFGKGKTCDIIVEDDGVSRVHAKLQLVNREKVVVHDLGSTNGTFVAGEKIEKAELKPDEKILFGRRTMVQFVLWDSLDHCYKTELFASCPRDGLTGINNRKYLRKRLVADISYARRHRIPFTFLLIDIDDFNAFNHDHGLYTGDQMLVTLCQMVSGIIRTEDVFGRHGADELAVLSLGMDLDAAKHLAKRISAEIAHKRVRSLQDQDVQVSVTVSVGVVTVDAKAIVDSGKVIDIATHNLNLAKSMGKGQIIASLLE